MGFYAIRRPKYLKINDCPPNEQLFPNIPVSHLALESLLNP